VARTEIPAGPTAREFAPALRAALDSRLASLPPTAELTVALARQRDRFRELTADGLRAEAAQLAARLDGMPRWTLAEVDAVTRLGHRLATILPVRDVLLAAFEAAPGAAERRTAANVHGGTAAFPVDPAPPPPPPCSPLPQAASLNSLGVPWPRISAPFRNHPCSHEYNPPVSSLATLSPAAGTSRPVRGRLRPSRSRSRQARGQRNRAAFDLRGLRRRGPGLCHHLGDLRFTYRRTDYGDSHQPHRDQRGADRGRAGGQRGGHAEPDWRRIRPGRDNLGRDEPSFPPAAIPPPARSAMVSPICFSATRAVSTTLSSSASST
jgi:hypothetical protein